MIDHRRSRHLVVPVLLALAAVTTAAGWGAAPAWAEETRFAVHVGSKGAKIIGSSMGGVRITVRDADTGEILSQGVTAGTTGDTDRMMQDPRPPGQPLSTPDAADYELTLDLTEPRLLTVTAYGPLAQRQAATEASVRLWAVPGKHQDQGDGIWLELPGFMVDVLAPPAHVRLGSGAVELAANVTMMCGCPITPGGLWDANAFEVRAWIDRDGERTAELPLSYSGTASQFAAEWTPPGPGLYEVLVYAHDPANGNTGLDRTTFLVAE